MARAPGSTTCAATGSRAASWPSCSRSACAASPPTRPSSPTPSAARTPTTTSSARLMKDHTVEGAYWEMAITDIDDALALLRPLYDESDGEDGFVSLEVSPALAHDTEATLKSARDLHERIAQPNLLVKVPATKEGVPAIETLIGEGTSINVTLIFGLDRYDEVMEAYLQRPRGPGGRRAARTSCPRWPAWPPSSSAGSTPRSTAAWRPWPAGRRVTPPSSACAAPPRWPRPRPPTSTSTAPSPVSAGRRCGTRAPGCSGRCGRRPRPRTRATPTCSTSTA